MPMTNKPYTIAMVGSNDVEINLYGEVVKAHPVDWWTGQPVPGDFIALDEFLRDLNELAGKDNITIHINSVGGDFYAGLAIYNRLRTLGASITTINDSLAASAGSIIFMAGDKGKRKMHAASNLMVHGVMTALMGYYNSVQLKAELKSLESHNKAAIAAYVEATGLDAETVKAAMSKDTYMTGEDAVAAGWADEVITDGGSEPVNMVLTPDKTQLMVNGHAVAASLFGNLPASIPQLSADEWAAMNAPKNTVMQPAPQADIKKSENGGKKMEFQSIDDLRSAFPDLVAQIETAARAEGATAERTRIQGIEDIQRAISDTELVRNAKFGENPMTAEQLAFKAMQAQAAIGATVLNSLEEDTATGGAPAVEPTPAEPEVPTKEEDEDEEAEKLLVSAIPENLRKQEVK